MSSEWPIVLGRVGAPHGVRGWFRVQSFARPPESILEHEHWLLETAAGWQRWELADSRIDHKGISARLRGCAGRDAVAELRHAAIAVARAALPPPGPGEWYWADLEGLRVETTDGAPLGRIDHLLETGANDVMVVRGDRERLIPWILDQVVRSVDIDQGRVVVDWDEAF